MGINLETVCNHQLFYDPKDKETTAKKMLDLLNSIEIPNSDFLAWFYRKWNNLADDAPIPSKEWSYYFYPEDDLSKEDSGIDFTGPFELELTLHPHIISFFSPSFRYWQWYLESLKDSYIEPWRQIYHDYTKHFGGNQLVYFRDAIAEMDLVYYPETTLDSLIKALKEKHVETFTKYHPDANKMDFDFYIENLENK